MSPQRNRVARNSPSNFHVFPSGSRDSPVQWNESGVISVKHQRIGLPLEFVPIWKISLPCQRPISSLRAPFTPSIQVTRQAWVDESQTRNVVPYMLLVLGRSAERCERGGMIQTSCT